ncbi:hypothetical protein ACVNS2_14230 [Paenibacillus caseinilyticus]|nr:hypothetical protein [Paenibacillus mucilaginosus]
MGHTRNVLVLMVIMAASLCASVYGAEYWRSTQTLEMRTSRPAEQVAGNPAEQGEAIVRDYFTALMNDKTLKGTPLTSFEIGRTDASDPDRIRVSVTAQFAEGPEWPPVDYFVVRAGDRYKVQKQVCVMEALPDTPGKLTARCTSDYTESMDGTVSVPGPGSGTPAENGL